jgi:crotonobetainyl-CoA:carnitine CoA-transferase CaiB-like acyl-CoA transferase
VRSSDFVLESLPDGELARYRLDFDGLRRLHPRIVHVQISAFGSDGPYAGYAASDLVIAALAGPVCIQGVRERPPVRLSVPQVWRHTGAEAAVAALVGHARMLATGEAQLVDVSAQCALTWTMLHAMEAHAIQGYDFERDGSVVQLGVVAVQVVFECADGYLVALPGGAAMRGLADRMITDGVLDPSHRDRDWLALDRQMAVGQEVPFDRDEMTAAMARFFLPYSKTELLEYGMEHGVTLAPVTTVPELLAMRHLEARGFWYEPTLPTGQKVRAPGLTARPARSPLSIRRPAPALDEHAEEIRSELGSAGGTRPSRARSPRREGLPLEGLKVADFSWIGVGPTSARYLADHGATVVRVESELRPDQLRGCAPFKDDVPGWNRSHFFGEFNASKLGLALHLKEPAGLEIARKLIAWADVYIESFAPGAVGRIGLDYEAARALNPSVVMMSTCLMGQTGPARAFAGYGYHAGAMSGFYEVTGWPDLPPDGPWAAYTDTIAPRFAASTLLAAIDHRRRTGEGQHIDAAQIEMALNFLAPEILDYQASGRVPTRMGNRARDAAPQGCYPCSGRDRWCAIAIDSEAQWQAMCQVMEKARWSADAGLSSVEGRLARHDELDAGISEWTAPREPREVMETLQAAGVPAGVVQRSSDLLRDPQYAHRGFHHALEHAEMGRIPYAGHQFRIRGYPSGPRSAAPTLGQHSFEVMRDLLGMSEDEIAQAFAAGAIT